MLENVLAGTLVALLVIFCACNILVSIRIFHAEGILKGVLGIVFWPYSIVWGWRRAKALRLRKLMWFWSSVPALVVLDLMAIAVQKIRTRHPDHAAANHQNFHAAGYISDSPWTRTRWRYNGRP